MATHSITNPPTAPRRPWWRRMAAPRWRLFPLATHAWSERLTRPGRYVITGAIATGIAGSLPLHMAGSFAFSFFAALIGTSALISTLIRPSVAVRRSLPRRCMAGSLVTLSIRVTNLASRPLHDIGAYEYRLPRRLKLVPEPTYIPRLEPGQSHTFEYDLHADRRGSYTLGGATAVSAFPFGLTQSTRHAHQQHRLVVHPAFTPLTDITMPLGQRYQPGGIVMASRVGESMEFIGNREYQPGDRVRDLHPRSWARVGKPIVRQYQQEYLTRVALLVDTHTRRGSRRSVLEANLSLAAAVADWLARQEYIVDLFAAGPELYQFQAGRSIGYLDEILDILACIDGCRRDPFERIAAEFTRQVRQTSAVVALLMGFDDRRRVLLEQVAAAGVAVKSIIITDDEDAAARAAAAVGARWIRPREVAHGVTTL